MELKKYIATALIGGAAVLAMGCTYFHVGYHESVYVAPLHTGDTIDGVASTYYELSEYNEPYDAFRYRVLERNRELLADGRVPQPGDMVEIPVFIKD